MQRKILDIYLGLVAEAHNHLAQEAPCLAVAGEQLGHGGVEGPVALESKKFVKVCNYLDSGFLRPAGHEVVLLLLQHADAAYHDHKAQQSCQVYKHV